MVFKLQILHASDLEGGVEAIDRAPNFAAITDFLEDEIANTITIAGGDNYLPGPFFAAAGDASLRPVLRTVLNNPSAREGEGRVDIAIMNIIGFDASALGNHEFDLGTNTIQGLIGTDIRDSNGDGTLDEARWLGTQFPYLSANLDFSNSNLAGLFTDAVLPNTVFQSPLDDLAAAAAPKIAPYTIIDIDGDPTTTEDIIGVVGGTTPELRSISSPGNVTVIGPDTNDMAALAEVIQPAIDTLTARGINKIVLTTHLQQIQLEQELVPQLRGVDVSIAAGSDTLLADAEDQARGLQPGDEPVGNYPILSTNADGDPVAIISTAGEYSYVGRLVVEFDEQGTLIPASIDPAESGAFASTDAGVTALWGNRDAAFAEGTKGSLVRQLTQAVQEVVNTQDANIFGFTNVFLEGRREQVRTEETNLGNLTADANLAIAQQTDPTVQISIKNGGGIRSLIGEISNDGQLLPPQPNPAVPGSVEGEVSQLDINNALRFNNGLSLLTLTADQLLQVIEHAVSESAAGETPGQFPQVAGIAFSFDPDLPAGDRVQSLAITDEDGAVVEVVVRDGELVGDADRPFRIVTLNFLAGGGDDYPFPDFEATANRVDLVSDDPNAPRTGAATFAPDGSEQDALAEYLASNFADTPFDRAETPAALDERIQNLNARADTVLPVIDAPGETPGGETPGNGEPGLPGDRSDLVDTQNHLLDLRQRSGIVATEFTLSREAANDNFAGFYQVADLEGGIDVDSDGSVDLRPGDAGYVEAAINTRAPIALTVANGETLSVVGDLQGGALYAPFLIANGRPDAFDSTEVFFGFSKANADGVSHVRSSSNRLAFEDLKFLGDRDFNDIVIAVKVNPVV